MTAMVTAGELMVARAGSVTPAHFPDEEFDLYSIPAHDRGSSEITVGRAIGSAKQLVRPGDVLLSKIVPHIRRAWVVGPNRGHRMIASGEWIVFRDERLNTRYLRHVLLGDPFHVQFMSTVAGVGGSLLRARPAFVAKIEIPLPTLEKQRRIAAILDQADDLQAKRREALDHLDHLAESIFLDMFGDPSTARGHDWELTTIGAVADIQGGLTVNAARKRNPIEVPYLRVANVHRGRLELAEIKTLRATEREIDRTRLQLGDLLVVEGHGNADEIGRGALWNGSIDGCVHQNHLIRVRFDRRSVLPVYGSGFINSQGGRRHLLRAGKTTSGLNTISVSDVRSTPIATPPVRLQETFAHRLDGIRSLQMSQQQAVTHLDALFASLQARAFAGGL